MIDFLFLKWKCRISCVSKAFFQFPSKPRHVSFFQHCFLFTVSDLYSWPRRVVTSTACSCALADCIFLPPWGKIVVSHTDPHYLLSFIYFFIRVYFYYSFISCIYICFIIYFIYYRDVLLISYYYFIILMYTVIHFFIYVFIYIFFILNNNNYWLTFFIHL